MNARHVPPVPSTEIAASRTVPGTAAPAVDRPAPPEPVAFPPDDLRGLCDGIVRRYPTRLAALLPILHVAQRRFGGWVSPEVEAGVAAYIGCSPAHVRGVLSFYAMYHTEPRGRHEVWICRTLTCWLRGAEALSCVAYEKAGLERRGNNHPQTGEDGRFTVMEMECLGLCEVAPAVFVDGEPHVEVTPDELGRLLDACE